MCIQHLKRKHLKMKNIMRTLALLGIYPVYQVSLSEFINPDSS